MKNSLLFAAMMCLSLLSTLCSSAQVKPKQVLFETNFEQKDALTKWKGIEADKTRLEAGFKSTQALSMNLPAGGNNNVKIDIPVPIELLRGVRIRIEAMVKAENVVKPPQAYNGIKVMLHHVSPAGARWDQQNNVHGTFDWKKVSFVTNVPATTSEASLILGLELTTGKVWFDDVKITAIDVPRSRPTTTPTGPIYKGHNLPRLRGMMISPNFKAADLQVLAGDWKANHIRWQLLWGGFPRSPADKGDLKAYDEWLEKSLSQIDALLPKCRELGVLMSIDLHTPPGGRNDANEMGLFQEKRFQDKFLELWEKIARRYKGDPNVWGYDLVNEPVEGNVAEGLMDWRELAIAASKRVRAIDAERALIVEPAPWADPGALEYFEPIPIKNVVYSVHMYLPHVFTHQGVHNNPSGFTYPGEISGKMWNKDALRAALKPVIDWQRDYGAHIYIGEFSAIRWAPNNSAHKYLSDCIEVFEENNWDWAYHAFREWHGWSVEHGSDPKDDQASKTPTDREQLMRAWFAKNVPAQPMKNAAMTQTSAEKLITVEAAETRLEQGEKLKLPRVEGSLSYNRGAGLRQIYHAGPGRGIPSQFAADPSSIVVRHNGQVLVKDTDYRFDPRWNVLALTPQSRITPQDEVSVDYRHSLLRVDSLVREANGREVVRRGKSHLTAPHPPELAAGETRVANVFVPYNSDGRNLPLWTIAETPDQAITLTTPNRLPRAMAKLRAGEPLKIVCWGDSVTEGGDVTTQEAYPAVFARRIQEKFPKSKIDVQVLAVGGSNSRQWLQPKEFPFPNANRQSELDWQRIVQAKPDVVTLEFVNDSYISGAQFEQLYGDILNRVRAIGAELVLITPHWVQSERGDLLASRQTEKRPYVLALREFATKNNLALADASSRWEHLWREGIPYATLLQNSFNHPDARGHLLFADELMKVFQP